MSAFSILSFMQYVYNDTQFSSCTQYSIISFTLLLALDNLHSQLSDIKIINGENHLILTNENGTQQLSTCKNFLSARRLNQEFL